MRKLKAIDLFSGAGGLSEGFMQTGKFDFVAHVEWELPMVETLRYNLVKRWGYKPEQAKKRVIKFDIQKTEELINGNWTQETIKDYGKDNDESVIKKGIDFFKDKKDIVIKLRSAVDEAMSYLKMLITLCKQNKIGCLAVIHGYGSSGKDGVIQTKARQWLKAQVRNGTVKAVINGEDFDVLNFKALELKNKYRELEKLLKVCNHGMTVVEI